MLRWFRTASAIALVSVSTVSASAPPGIALVGIGYIPGSALDKSGLTGSICQASAPATCIPRATFGGLGSDLAYTGHDNVYIAAPDRGPFDGLTVEPYLDRVHFLHLTTDLATKQVKALLLDTRFLKNEYGQTFVGSTGAFDVDNELNTLRLDPEGIRASADGTFFVSDEYGPYLFEFNRQGHLTRRIEVPESFRIVGAERRPDAGTDRQYVGAPGQSRHGGPGDQPGRHARCSA